MEYALVGGPDSGTTLRLDYRAFAYAGKFVVGAPGKAVLRTSDGSPAVPEWEPDEPLPPTVEASEFDDDVVAAISSRRTEPTPTAVASDTSPSTSRAALRGSARDSSIARSLDSRPTGTTG